MFEVHAPRSEQSQLVHFAFLGHFLPPLCLQHPEACGKRCCDEQLRHSDCKSFLRFNPNRGALIITYTKCCNYTAGPFFLMQLNCRKTYHFLAFQWATVDIAVTRRGKLEEES